MICSLDCELVCGAQLKRGGATCRVKVATQDGRCARHRLLVSNDEVAADAELREALPKRDGSNVRWKHPLDEVRLMSKLQKEEQPPTPTPNPTKWTTSIKAFVKHCIKGMWHSVSGRSNTPKTPAPVASQPSQPSQPSRAWRKVVKEPRPFDLVSSTDAILSTPECGACVDLVWVYMKMLMERHPNLLALPPRVAEEIASNVSALVELEIPNPTNFSVVVCPMLICGVYTAVIIDIENQKVLCLESCATGVHNFDIAEKFLINQLLLGINKLLEHYGRPIVDPSQWSVVDGQRTSSSLDHGEDAIRDSPAFVCSLVRRLAENRGFDRDFFEQPLVSIRSQVVTEIENWTLTPMVGSLEGPNIGDLHLATMEYFAFKNLAD